MPMTLQVGAILLVEIPARHLAQPAPAASTASGSAYAATFCVMFALQGAYYALVWSAAPPRRRFSAE